MEKAKAAGRRLFEWKQAGIYLLSVLTICILVASTGEAGEPVEGEDWTSPATGMEFVWIDKLDCWVGRYEVTNGQYREMNPDHDSGAHKGHGLNDDRQPVVQVNFSDTRGYADWLTQRDREEGGGSEELEYRLPTKEEWTTIARVGDGRKYPWGENWPPKSGQAGNYADRTLKGAFDDPTIQDYIEGYEDGYAVTCEVEDSWENPWGLHGVGGNVREYTTKTAGGEVDALRGAGWRRGDRASVGCTFRSPWPWLDTTAARSSSNGFRLVLSP